MRFQKKADTGGGGDKYLKLKDGESKKVILRGEPYEFHVKWDGSKYQPANEGEAGSSSRYKMNIVSWEEGRFKPRLWEFPQTICNKLADMMEEYPLDRTLLKITRQGTGSDTEYHLLPLAGEKDKLSSAALTQIGEVEMLIMDAPRGAPKERTETSSDEIPF